MKNIFFTIITLLVVTSCIPKKEVVYFQGVQANSENLSGNYEPLIQNDDMLYINISSFEAEASAPFNLESHDESSKSSGGAFPMQKQTYLVDNNGNIEFPILGTMQVAGYSIKALREILKDRLSIYIKDAVINIRIVNFKVTVIGEVRSPGTVQVDSQRITLTEALARAGDLTIYGKRNNILIIRDFQGTKTYTRVDITKTDFVNSPYYYLDQNDVVYIEPRRSKTDDATFGNNLGTIMSLVGFGVSLMILLTR
jgi:polysaccharide export outer membrane protein